MMLALSNSQLEKVMLAASLVGQDDRKNLLRSIAAQLRTPKPSDGELVAGIVYVLQARGVSVSPDRFFENSSRSLFKCPKPKSSKAKKISTKMES